MREKSTCIELNCAKTNFMEGIYVLSLISLLLGGISEISGVVYSCNRTTQCGCSKTNAVLNKIVGGEAAVDSSWGWAVSLQIGNGHFCGGTVISPLHVLTAAHCVTDPTDTIRRVKAVVGINELSKRPPATTQERTIARVFAHAQYNDQYKFNDIAILQLSQPLTITSEKGAARLCLPHIASPDAADAYPSSHSTLVAIGWGRLTSADLPIPVNQHLQQVTVNQMPYDHRMCKSTIYHQQLQFCAAVNGGGKDTCQGDSGGPLMQFDAVSRQWILVGVTSYGRGCAHPNYAGVYTRVSMYRNWIRSIVGNSSMEVPVAGAGKSSTNSLRSELSVQSCLILGLFYIFAQMYF